MSFKNIMERFMIPEANKASLAKNQRIQKNLINLMNGYEFKAPCLQLPKSKSNLLVFFATQMPNKDISREDKKLVRDYILTELVSSHPRLTPFQSD